MGDADQTEHATTSAGPDAVGRAGVSVVIPTHGRPVEVDRAVRSVLAEGYPGPLEVLVVFDGEPARPLPEPDRPGVEVLGIGNSRSRGLAGARNTGIMRASHEFVAFLDDDDEWLTGRLVAQLELFRAHPDCVMVGGSIEAVNERGTFVRTCPPVITHRDLLRRRVTELHPCTYVLRTAALRGPLGLVDEDLPGSFAEDYDLAIRAAAIAPVRAVPQPVARINWIGQSFFIAAWERNAAATEHLISKHDFGSDPAALARLEGYIAYCLAAAGKRSESRVWARRALSRNFLEKRALLSLLLGVGPVTPERLAGIAARLGRRW